MMKYYVLIIFVLNVFKIAPKENGHYSNNTQMSQKEKAFKVLQTKCNVCHATKKKLDIFTYENMDSLATEINKQVFIKKKMPKGKKIKLTLSERENLLLWIQQIKNKA